MHGPWVVSPALAEQLGPQLLSQLADLDPDAAHTCQVCGQTKPAGDSRALAVIAAAAAGVTVLGLAHVECRDQVGDYWPALLEQIGRTEVDSLALVAQRVGVRPRSILAFDQPAAGRQMLPAGEVLDPYLAVHLEYGFSLLSEPISEVVPPLARGWVVNTRGGSLTVEHPALGASYSQPLNAEIEGWIRVARGEGLCLVVTGTGLSIDPADPLGNDFSHAMRRGRVVAATMKVR